MKKAKTLHKTCIALAIANIAMVENSYAARFLVNSGLDQPGVCTMQAAVAALNGETPSGFSRCTSTDGSNVGSVNSIEFSVSNITGINSDLVVTRNVDINPSGNSQVRFFGTGSSRVFKIENSAEVTMNNVRITGGSVTAENGGGILVTEGSELELMNSQVSNNEALLNTINGMGGGIAVMDDSTLSLMSSSVNDNSASSGGGIMLSDSAATISNSLISSNEATIGGGVAMNSGVYTKLLTIDESIISDNETSASGAGIWVSGSMSVDIDRSSIINNNANGNGVGGGIFVYSSTFIPNLSLHNSTVSGNEASRGGGIEIGTSALVDIIHSTISNNTADSEGGGINIEVSAQNIDVENSLIAGNYARNTPIGVEINSVNNVSLHGRNLFGDSRFTNSQAIVGVSPQAEDITATSNGSQPTAISSILEPLSGIETMTLPIHPLSVQSPATGNADATICSESEFSFDQIGEARLFEGDNRCDIGAVESLFANEPVVDESVYVISLPNGKTVIFSL